MKLDQPSSSRGSLFRFRLWHIFFLVAVAAWYAPRIPIFGNCQAIVEIEKITVTYDEVWGKHWAILDGRFIAPGFLKKEKMECFIAVPPEFSFGDKYSVGDQLRFRYQHREFGRWPKEDPRQIVAKEFFGFQVMPMEYDSGLLIHVGDVGLATDE